MKANSNRNVRRRRHDVLREFFACAVVIAAIKSGDPGAPASAQSGDGPSPAGRV
ncbi:MAG: hypothetical protein JWL81_2765 [Verrucomicrobiales bacterium]|nr:hypothetical protein [Verrucomicrobiales bacterium]